MYEPFVTVAPYREKDGMVHFAVEFRGDGLETITRKSFTSTFTVDWFKRWCKQQATILNEPQEIAGVTVGAVDLTGIVIEEPVDTEKETYRDNVRLISRLNWIRDNFDPNVVSHKDYTDCVTALTKDRYREKHLAVIPAR